ncbi:tol-pal system-associated acyl-CoA thioesterase [Thauera sinica]|nr:tol-pal system-associated acyl-CoA thioesterase [Thauera sp. K11]ATE61316.1 tol-pal system-associated acyl-CoA thioesterase [Thauera sp. K11]
MHIDDPGRSPTLPAAACGTGNGFRMPVRVYYEDTDAAGVVYYANYLRFCERARTEWLRALGFEQQALLAAEGVGFVVRSVRADYLSPARLDDGLTVVSSLAGLRRASLDFRQEIMRDDERLFVAHVVLACVDWRRQRPVAIPAAMQQRFQTYAIPA